MLNIQEQLLFTTLRIECYNDADQLYSIGTGFLLSKPVVGTKSKIYLVSNKHVLVGPDSIALTFTQKKGEEPEVGKAVRLPIKSIKPYVASHPNPNVDIAILDCTGFLVMFQDKLFIKAVGYEMLADFTEPELNIAEDVLFVGYPDNRFDVMNNFPLVRRGMIASHPKYDYNGSPMFVIDAQVFPGSSGSPVYIDLTYENFKNGVIALGQKNLKLLGIVSQTMIRNNQLQAINTSSQLVTPEVLGLGIVFKSTAIKELVDTMPINNC